MNAAIEAATGYTPFRLALFFAGTFGVCWIIDRLAMDDTEQGELQAIADTIIEPPQHSTEATES